VTVGGGTSNNSIALAVWNIEDLLHSQSLPIPKFVQVFGDTQHITCLTVDTDSDDLVTI